VQIPRDWKRIFGQSFDATITLDELCVGKDTSTSHATLKATILSFPSSLALLQMIVAAALSGKARSMLMTWQEVVIMTGNSQKAAHLQAVAQACPDDD
jgi:hypothetical protein